MKYLRIKVIPKSPKNEVVEVLEDKENGNITKIRIKAAPERNRANLELIKFLSTLYKVPKENIVIISGQKEQLKLIRIDGLN